MDFGCRAGGPVRDGWPGGGVDRTAGGRRASALLQVQPAGRSVPTRVCAGGRLSGRTGRAEPRQPHGRARGSSHQRSGGGHQPWSGLLAHRPPRCALLGGGVRRHACVCGHGERFGYGPVRSRGARWRLLWRRDHQRRPWERRAYRGPSGERLYAGGGADVLRGRGGGDLLSDASTPGLLRSGDPSPFVSDEGPVALADPGRGRDSFDGGSGRGDTVSYEARRAGVRVDLANPAAIGGGPGERDSVKGVESAFGPRATTGWPGTDARTGSPAATATTASRAGEATTASKAATAAM
jgi:hypothetical protein